MNKSLTVNNHFSGSLCVPCIQSKRDEINRWLEHYEQGISIPFYSSVDIRDAGFKIAVVDTNLFPAGFNNLCEHGLADAVGYIKEAVNRRVPGVKNILIATEAHTRNLGYLENVHILQRIISQAGFKVELATPDNIHTDGHKPDLIIMNNDLTGGIPDSLKEAKVPVFPSMQAGWHSRHKSEHFQFTKTIVQEFCGIVGLDPWQFSCLYEFQENVDINLEADRRRLYETGVRLFTNIQAKYKEHDIDSKPFIFLKSDSGTYGLGVMPIEDPQQILTLNSRKRHDLERSKGGVTVHRFLLQEGVPTIHRIEENPCEVCIYQIDNHLVGGFYRYHTGKSPRENLNSPGGGFQKICPHLDKYGQDCEIPHNLNIFDIYRILARIAGIAARWETKELERRSQ